MTQKLYETIVFVYDIITLNYDIITLQMCNGRTLNSICLKSWYFHNCVSNFSDVLVQGAASHSLQLPQ